MAIVNKREEELVKTIDADHIPACFWRLAARDMELLGMGSELELLAKRRYAEAIAAVCERAEQGRSPTRARAASAGESGQQAQPE